MQSPQPVFVRALNIGEIFDRAITLLIQNWAAFILIETAAIVPPTVLEFVAQITGRSTLFGISFVIGVLLGTVATLACGKLVADIYKGREPDWRAAISLGLRRLPRGVGALLIAVLGFLAPGVILAGVIGLGTLIHMDVALRYVAGATVAVIAVTIFAMVSLVCMYALAAIAIEDRRVGQSIAEALSLLSVSEIRKNVGFGLVLALVSFGGSAAGTEVRNLLSPMLHSYAIPYSVQFLISVIASGLADVLIAVYYFDVRIRRHGYDLQVAIEALT